MAKGFIGVDKVMANINREIGKIKNRSVRGLIKAAIVIRRDMDKTPPLIPVDLGNLRASFFITTATGVPEAGGNFKGDAPPGMSSDHASVVAGARSKAAVISHPIVILGFSANYARAVEESERFKEGKRPGSGPRFFESSLKRNSGLIVKIIATEARRS